MSPENDTYPVITPEGFSARLTEFFHAIDRCTTKRFVFLDTMPGRRKDGHVPGGNSIDTLTHPQANLVFLDAARVHEAVIAHELGHAWVQYVDECEDLRTVKDARNPQRMRQVGFVQSFVLDLKVNEVLRRKGFDMTLIEDDQAASIRQLASALQLGYEPDHPREEVFMALLLGDLLVAREQSPTPDLLRYESAFDIVRKKRPSLFELAQTFSAAVARHGLSSQARVMACVDECLLASFSFCGDSIDLDGELLLVNPDEPNVDKFPEWLPPLTPKSKCAVGKYMARNEIGSTARHRLRQGYSGRAIVEFENVEHGAHCKVVLNEHIGPPSKWDHLPEELAENEFIRERNQAQVPGAVGRLKVDGSMVTVPGGSVTGAAPGHGHWYMAGLGRFLTHVRQYEWLRGEHAYSYAFDNPVSYVDLDGNRPSTLLWPIAFPPRDYAGRLHLPPNESYVRNCCDAMQNPYPTGLGWFYGQVRNGGPWDYKQTKGTYQKESFQDAGSYNYGFVAACAGIPLELALWAAGQAQIQAGTSKLIWQRGGRPYGDDPVDQYYIEDGYNNASRWMSELRRKCGLCTMEGAHQQFLDWRDNEINRLLQQDIQPPRRWWE